MNRIDCEASLQHITRALEDACEVMSQRALCLGAPAAEQCAWVVDFHGYSFLKDSNPRTAVMTGRLLAHYPERLGRAVLVDAPRVFAGTWSAARQVINPATASKVVFVRSDDGSLEAELGRW